MMSIASRSNRKWKENGVLCKRRRERKQRQIRTHADRSSSNNNDRFSAAHALLVRAVVCDPLALCRATVIGSGRHAGWGQLRPSSEN